MKSLRKPVLTAALAASSLLLLQCGEQGSFNPSGPEIRLVLFAGLAATPNRVAAGGGQSVISGRVIDQQERPYVGAAVTFRAGKGLVDEADTTDADGAFSAEYRSGNSATTDTVTVTVLGEEASVFITVVGVTAQLTLELGHTSVLANGLDTTLAMAILIGSEGPITRVPVRFETTAGDFNGQSITYANTDNAGVASVILTAPSSTTEIAATVTATVAEQTVSLGGPRGAVFRAMRGIKRDPERDDINAEANKTITFRGVTIQVEADPALMPGDGRTTARIRALVKEQNHQAVAAATVSFSAELGSLQGTALTSSAGVAEVTLTAARVAGATDHIVARYGPVLADTVLITYAEAVANLELGASPASILADGVSSAVIQAVVLGGTGQPSPEIEIDFSADAGIIFPTSAVTNNQGIAETRLYSPGSEADVPITVRAEVAPQELRKFGSSEVPESSGSSKVPEFQSAKVPKHSGTIEQWNSPVSPIRPSGGGRDLRRATPAIQATAVDSIVVLARGMKLRVSVSPDSIIARAGASSAVTAIAFETRTGNPVVGDTVRFAAMLGSIPSHGVLDQDGRARVTFMAGEEIGRAEVLARFGASHRDSAIVELLPTIGALAITSDRRSLLAGGLDTALVTVRVTDALGGVASNVAVIYEIDYDPGQRQMNTDPNGLARFDVVSPAAEADTAVWVRVSSGDITQDYRTGVKAITRTITAAPDSVSAGSEIPVNITLRAYELTSRRPVVGDTVWFSAADGVVQPFAVLDHNGVSRTTFLVGPEPATAWVVGQLGILGLDSVRIDLVEPIARLTLSSARPSVLENGLDTTLIIARVANVLDQPTPRVWVQFETDAGVVSPLETLTDDNGRAYTRFTSVAGSDDRPAEVNAVATHVEPLVKVDNPPSQTLRKFQSSEVPKFQSSKVQELLNSGTLELSEVAALPRSELVLRPFDADEVSDTMSVLMRGINLDLRLEPGLIRANGNSKSGINVQLSETTNGSPIANALVRFGATMGVIPAERTTSGDGTITDSLTSGLVAGYSVVRATYGNTISVMDSVRFTPDPARLTIALTVDPAEAPADGETDIALSSQVVDVSGDPIEGVEVRYTLEGGRSVLVDPQEYREVTRWQNTFRVDNAAAVTGLRLRLHLRGVDTPGTQIYLNREVLNFVELPMDRLWAEAVLNLPENLVNNGVNRIEIIAGRDEDLEDRFSVAGVRLELLSSHLISEEVTDADGRTSASTTADRVEGIYVMRATLTDDTSRYTEETLVLTPREPAIVLAAAAADTLLASGIDDADVVALVTDENGNPASEGYEVNLSVDPPTGGTVDPEQATTLGDGTVSARFFAPSSEENLTTDLVVECEGVEGRWSLLLQGVALELTSEEDRMLADGESITAVQARLETADGDPIVGRRVSFQTTAGSITPSVPSDADGVAIATLTAADTAGTATITATFGSDISRETEVTFVPVVQLIAVTAEPASVRGNGKERATLQIEVTDGLGRGAAGIRVDLSADQGRLSTIRVTTDGDGRASAQLTGFATIADDTIQVIATTTDYDLADAISVLVRGVTIELSADPDSIIAREGASSAVTARVYETNSGNPVTGDTVRFAATRGIITGFAGLNDEGLASVAFSGEERTGSSEITARYTDVHRDTTYIELLPQIAAMQATADRRSLLTGGIDRSQISVTVTDALGGPAPDVAVAYEIDWNPGEVNYVGTDEDGRASFYVYSPPAETDSALQVTVSAGNLEEVLRIGILGITRRIGADPDSLSAGGGEVTITFSAVESDSRRPVVGDTVWFSATDGTIQPSGILNQSGVATTTLEAGDTPGETWVIGQLGNLKADSVRVVLVEQVSSVALSCARRSLRASGEDTTRVTARVENDLGQPAVGVTVLFATEDGTVEPEIATADENGEAWTLFTGEASSSDLDAVVAATAFPSEEGRRLGITPGDDEDAPGQAQLAAGPVRFPRALGFEGGDGGLPPGLNPVNLRQSAYGGRPNRDQGEVTDSITVELRGITLTLHTNPREIRADGRSRAGVDIQLSETTSGQAIGNAQIRLGASLGSISSSGETGDDGRLTDSLIAGVQPGTSIVRAWFGNLLTTQDTVLFTYDPARLRVSLTLDPEETTVTGGDVDLQAQVVNSFGASVPDVLVRFTAEGALTALVDADEYRQVTRWENSFRVADPEDVDGLMMRLQIRGVDSDETKIYLNRTALDVTLPSDPLWQDAALELPADQLISGANRIEIIGGDIGGESDRFSVAGIRLGVTASHLIEEATTDGDGIAIATFTPDEAAGSLMLRAAIADNPERFAQSRLTLLPGDPALVRVATEADMLFGNGLEETDLLALVTDANGNPVSDGFDVNFTADSAGSISPASTQTLGDGTASARFTAPVLDEDIAALATAECEGASESWSLLLRGVQLALTAEDDRLLADGHSTTSLRAHLSTPDGAAITSRRIDFTTSGGAITRFATTDETGVAAATLTAGSEPDTAMVTANFGPYLADTLQVIFNSLISGLELSADPASLLGDGQSRTTVTIAVFNGVGDPASGVRVNLAASAGRLSRSSLTTGNDGQGQATLTGFTATDDDSIMVTAAISEGALTDTMFVVVRGIDLTVTADRDSLPANGAATTTVTARAVETGSGNPVTGARVSFSVSGGSITASVMLDEDGLGEVVYTAAAAEGTATIRARLGAGLQAETSVILVDPVAALTLDITPSAILANGVQTAEITARVTDPWGEPTPNELVTIDFSGPGSVTPSLGNTDENGRLRAAAKGTASGSDGQLIITAEAHGGDLIQTDTLLLRGVTLALSASPALIPGDGQSTATITARVRETRTGRAVASGTVSFIASAGVIAAEAQLDQSGEASVELRSDDRTAISEVVAFYGDELTDTIQVAFAGRYSYLDARSGRASLLADGEDTTAIAATLTDTLGNASSGIWVRFNVGGADGTLSGDSALSDVNGRASVLFTSAAATSDAVAQVISAAGVLSDTVSIARQGLTLTVAVAPDSLPANGRSSANVTARVRKTSGGNPITGRPVSFAVTAGLITGSSVLDQQGVARVQLTADDSAGTATITASFGQTLGSAANVVYVGTEGSVELTATRGTLLSDGVTNVQVTALVLDELGSPAEGATVNFSAPDGGRLSPGSAQTDRDGLATVTFTGFASHVDSVLTIDAVTGGGAADDVTLRLLGITTELSASPSQLRANGRATSVITLKAYETTAHNALADYEILFNADRGTIGRTATTGADGQAAVTFTAPASVGDATINAVLGDTLLTTISLPCLASQPARATLSVDPRELSVAGVGGDETALLSADVTDDDRQPVPDGTVITFTVQPDIGVIFAGDDDTVDVTTEDGIAIATVVAGDESGAVTFKALFGNSVLATGAELTIKGGPPARIRVRPDVNTIYQPAGGVSALPVSATVSDQFGNPAPDSTAVRFTLVPDTIAVVTATGYTEGGVVMTPVQPIDYPTGVWLTYDDDRAGSEVWVHATSGGGAAHDSSRVVLPGAIEGGDPASMALSIDDAVLPADGQTTAEVTVELFDANGNAVADLTEVTFTSVWGTIQRTKQTAGGVVTNTYRAGRNAGVDTVTVTSGLVSEFITIRLTPGNPAAIEVAAADPVIRAGGVQATDITATVRDQFGNLVAAGARVDFTTDLGTITSNAETDAAGVARARLTSGNIIGTTQVTARSGNAVGQTSVRFVSGGADGIVLQSISRNSIGVRGSGSPETATLVFEVRDEWGVPVDSSHRAYVQFTLDGPALVIDPAQSSADSVAFLEPSADSTDDNGRVAVNLTSGFFAGTVEVTAFVSPNISGQAIAVAIHGGPPDFDHLSLIVERCVLTGIYGTEVDTTRLTAVVGDRYANPTVPGTIVYFSASGGVVTASGTTDSLGVCNALLTTSNPWPIGGVDSLTVQTVDWNDQDITAENYVLVTGPTIVSFDTSSGWAIPFGSYRDFTVTVADTFDHPLVAGTSVFIQVEAVDQNGETVSGLRVIGDATEEAYVIGECDGKKDFSVRVFNFVTGLDGALITMTVTVESRNGNVEAMTSGAALGQVVSTDLSRVILNPNEIIADGADECTVNITVYDVLGVAIPGVPPDMVSVSIAAGNPIITQPQASSDQDGRTSATIVGRALGSGNVQARVTGLLLTEQPTLTFIPGPPAAISVLVLNRRLVVGGDSTTVVVNVTDASGNNVADGTAVIFEADDGSFSPSSAVTSGGGASSLFRSGITAGAAAITITASGQGAEVSEEVANLVFLPGPPGVIVISADNYSVEVGAATDVTITVKDQFGNVVTENTRMDVTVSPSGQGSVAPTSIRTDADGSGGVQYTAGTTAGETARLVVTDPAGGASDSSAAFVFKAGPARRVTLTASPSSATVGTAIDLDATVTDAYGNDVSDGTLVTFIREPAVGTVNPSSIGTVGGAASSRLTNVTTSGSVTVTATSGDVNGLATIQFAPDALSTILLSAEPSEIDSGRVSTITATAKDRFGNVIAGERLNFELTNDLGGTVSLWRASLNTNASGVATNYITGGNQSGWAEVRVYNVGDTIEETVAVRVR